MCIRDRSKTWDVSVTWHGIFSGEHECRVCVSNAYVHNEFFYPKADNLITGWDNIESFFIQDVYKRQTLLIPEEYSVVATLNLNGDYISDQLAAMVGGIGIIQILLLIHSFQSP